MKGENQMMIFKYKRWVGLACVLVIIMAAAANAAGTLYISKTTDARAIRNLAGTRMDPMTANIQFFIGSYPAPTSNTGALEEGVGFDPRVLEGDNVKFNFPNTEGTLYVRIWEGAIGSSNYYVTSAGYDYITGATVASMVLTAPPSVPKFYIRNGQTIYQPAPPPAPTVTTLLKGYNLSIHPIVRLDLALTHPNHEVAAITTANGAGTYLFRVRRQGTTAWYYYPTSSTAIEPNPDDAMGTGIPFSLSTIYEFQAAAKNAFVLADESNLNWSTPVSALDMGTLPGGGSVNISLKRTLTSGLGINSFSVPSANCTISNAFRGTTDRTSAITSASIDNAFDLCKAINDVQGGPLVRTIGYWNQDSQIEMGYVIIYSGSSIDAASEAALRAITFEPGRGYQLYIKPDGTDADVSITFTLTSR